MAARAIWKGIVRFGDESIPSSQGSSGSKANKSDARKSTAKKTAAKKRGRFPADAKPLDKLSKDALYRQAVEQHIAGRSTMSKRELIDALRQNRSRAAR